MSIRYFSTILWLFILTQVSGQTPPSPPAGMKWEIISGLSDEFNNGFDNSKWKKVLWNYEAPVNMLAENSGVSGGNLWIKATLGTGERWFNTSRIYSQEQVKFPMYTECRMKTAHISAFSTFWLNNGDSNNRDEIDICEHNTKPSWPDQEDRPYQMYAQYFVVKDGVTERDHAPRTDTRNLSAGNPAKNKKWNEAYQVLGCYWKDKNNVEFYINGEFAGAVKSTQDFTRSQNIIWDLWTSVHSWTGGIADKNDLSNNNINTMYVDWIHTYKLVVDDTPPVAGSIQLKDPAYYKNTSFFVGDMLSVQYEFNAGSNATVGADGVKIWLREMTSAWQVVKDYTVVDKSVVGKASGNSSINLSLQNVLPSESLASGNFYFLFLSYKNSRGEDVNVGLNPVKIVDPLLSNTEGHDKINLMAFPNPTVGIVKLSVESNWSLFTPDGKLLEQGTGDEIDLTTYESGLYLLHAENQVIKIYKGL